MKLGTVVVDGDDALVEVGNGGESLLGEVDLMRSASRAIVHEPHADRVAVLAAIAIARNVACLAARVPIVVQPIVGSNDEVVRQELARVILVACRCYIVINKLRTVKFCTLIRNHSSTTQRECSENAVCTCILQ